VLDDLVRRDKFSSDLRCRLRGYRIVLPSLRQRRADIPELVLHFVSARAPECGYSDGPPALDAKLMRALVLAPWPFNVRQLDQTVSMLMVEADGAPRVTCKHLRDDLAYLAELADGDDHRERAEIEMALAQAQYNRTEAARLLSMPRSTFYRRLEKLEMSGDDTDPPRSNDLFDATG
jgi:DNA-binding NtrC family response regulator